MLQDVQIEKSMYIQKDTDAWVVWSSGPFLFYHNGSN